MATGVEAGVGHEIPKLVVHEMPTLINLATAPLHPSAKAVASGIQAQVPFAAGVPLALFLRHS